MTSPLLADPSAPLTEPTDRVATVAAHPERELTT